MLMPPPALTRLSLWSPPRPLSPRGSRDSAREPESLRAGKTHLPPLSSEAGERAAKPVVTCSSLDISVTRPHRLSAGRTAVGSVTATRFLLLVSNLLFSPGCPRLFPSGPASTDKRVSGRVAPAQRSEEDPGASLRRDFLSLFSISVVLLHQGFVC